MHPDEREASAGALSSGSRRPAFVTWLCLGVITLAGVQLAGLLGALRLPDLPLAVPRAYLMVRNGIWALWGLAAAAGAFGGRSWAPSLLRWGALGMAGWYWADQILLAQSAYSRLGIPVRAATTLLLLGVGWWSLDRPAVRRFFEENHG